MQSLLDSLSSDKVTSWMNNKIKGAVDKVVISSIKFQDNHMPLEQLDNLLKKLAEEFPPYTMLIDKNQPVFFIDEVNRLRSLFCNRDGRLL